MAFSSSPPISLDALVSSWASWPETWDEKVCSTSLREPLRSCRLLPMGWVKPDCSNWGSYSR